MVYSTDTEKRQLRLLIGHDAQKQLHQSIEGRDVPLPKKLTNLLSLPENKADLFQAPDDREIVFAGGFREELEVRSSKTTTDLTQLRATHEEADTRMVLHAVHSQFNTDVLVLSSCSVPRRNGNIYPLMRFSTTYQEIRH